MSEILLAHNHDTSFKALAKMLNDNLNQIYSHDPPHLQLCDNGVGRDIVSIVTRSLKDDLPQLIASIKKGDTLLPQVIIAKSISISPPQTGITPMKFQYKETVKLVNEVDENDFVTLRGQSFAYESPAQIVILSRDDFVAQELSLSIVNILANSKTVKYDLPMKSITDDTYYRVKDVGNLKLKNINTMVFSDATDNDSGMVVVAAEFNILDNYFIFREWNDIATQYTVNSTP